MIELRRQHYNSNGLGLADFFPIRHKRKLLELAEVKPSDTFFDLGCGDASLLVFAVTEFGVKKAVGFENNPARRRIAMKKVEQAGLSERIHVQTEIGDADLGPADVIFDMLPESEGDLESLYSEGIRDGTRLLKHDLPLVGIVPDATDIPFYRMTFPLAVATSRNKWAESVLSARNSSPNDVWHELLYYEKEKAYTMWDIRRLERIFEQRIPQVG